MVAPVLAAQEADGAWTRGDLHWQGGKQRVTMLALMRLGFLGFGPEHQAVRSGAEYLFSLQQQDGRWSIPGQYKENDAWEKYEMVPLQTALPLRALAMTGYAEDPRAERAYAWLLDKRLPDGAWPTGQAGHTGTWRVTARCLTRDGVVVPTPQVFCSAWRTTLCAAIVQKRSAHWICSWDVRRGRYTR